MEPIDYVGALRRSWRLLVALAIVGAIVAVVIPVSHHKKIKSGLPYAASAIVGSPPNAVGSPLHAGVSSQQIVFFATSSATQRAVASDVGLDVSSSALSAYMSATVISATGVSTKGASAILKRNAATLVQLTGFGATSQQAVAVANDYASEVGQAVQNGLESSPRGKATSTGYAIQQMAVVGTQPGGGVVAGLSGSRKVRAIGGLVVGALLGAALVLLRELLDKRLRSSGRAEANFGFPVVVEIPLTVTAGKASVPGLVPVVDVIRDPDSPGAEAYRMLRMSVMFEPLAPMTGPTDPFAAGFGTGMGALPPAEPAIEGGAVEEIGERRVIMVVSAGSEPTRPHAAANLAAIYAEAGQTVVVMSTGDLEPGRNKGNATGEIRVDDVAAALEPSRLGNVFRLPLGSFIANSGQLVMRAPAVLDATRRLADLVIVEVPPLLAVHHAEALVREVDAVLVVAECKFTTFDEARAAGDLLRRMGAPVLGIVLTNVRLGHSDIRHVALLGSTDTEAEADHDEEAVLAVGAGVGSSGSTSQTRD